MRKPLALLVLCVFAGWSGGQSARPPVPPTAGEQVTDFGFWTGKWAVSNTRFDPDRQVYFDAGEARATVEPLFGGGVLLERWEGETGQIASTFGISLRYFDERWGRWVVVLNWPGGEPTAARFSQMQGRFDDGMIALHPPRVFQGDDFDNARFHSTRFVFSDVSDDACRWQLQMPTASRSWNTMWEMRFARESSPAGGAMRLDPVPTEPVCASDEARLTDWMVGAWAGEGVTLRVSSALRGCGVLAELEVDRDNKMKASSLLAIAWDASSQAWQVREVGLNRPLISLVWEAVGRVSGQGMVLRSKGADDLSGMVFRRLDDGVMQFELTLPGGERLDAELKKL
jgi:hypothetical protein